MLMLLEAGGRQPLTTPANQWEESMQRLVVMITIYRVQLAVVIKCCFPKPISFHVVLTSGWI